jgi:hypothetical protein
MVELALERNLVAKAVEPESEQLRFWLGPL